MSDKCNYWLKFMALLLLVSFTTLFTTLLAICLLTVPARYPSEAPSIITVLLFTGVPMILFFSWLIKLIFNELAEWG